VVIVHVHELKKNKDIAKKQKNEKKRWRKLNNDNQYVVDVVDKRERKSRGVKELENDKGEERGWWRLIGEGGVGWGGISCG
jgi:ERCC4-type nuclease